MKKMTTPAKLTLIFGSSLELDCDLTSESEVN